MSAKHAVRMLYNIYGSWRAVADEIGDFSPAYWRKAAAGEVKLSTQAEDALRFRLRLPPRNARRIERMSDEVLARYFRTRGEVGV